MSPKADACKILEQGVLATRFSMPTVLRALLGDAAFLDDLQKYAAIQESLSKPVADHVLRGILRSVFLIELVKTPKIETTKFEVRWAKRLGSDDPRYAIYDECVAILDHVLTELAQRTADGPTRELMRLFYAHNLVAYEIPLDYRERRNSSLHRANNFLWTLDDLSKRVVTLRGLLLDPKANPYVEFFRLAYSKIVVKTYLTDRVLTGNYKTNREKRWETHPASPHFALRRTCFEIEYSLVNQLCHFDAFPQDLLTKLTGLGVLTPLERPVRCPITLDPLSFKSLQEELLNPVQGKASFQVGHLNPLKAADGNGQAGHTAANVSWISSNGNRIQGHLSLAETRKLIARIYDNYKALGLAGSSK